MKDLRPYVGIVLACLAAGCGGSASSPSPAQTTPFTQTFSGTTRTASGTCTGDSHDFPAAAGDIAVKLAETSDPAGALSVQVCAGGIDNGNCSIKQQKITVGQTITGARVGSSPQNLKFLGHNCVFGGPTVTEPISYRADVTYQR
jgi:hypothetical protein